MQAARLCELLYNLDFRLVMLKLQLVRANGFRPEEDMAELHSKVAELSWKKEQVAREKLHVANTLKQEALQMGNGICLSQTFYTLLQPTS